MKFHCQVIIEGWKAITLCPVRGGFDQSNLPGAGNLTKKFVRGLGFGHFLKFCPGMAQEGGGMVTLGTD